MSVHSFSLILILSLCLNSLWVVAARGNGHSTTTPSTPPPATSPPSVTPQTPSTIRAPYVPKSPSLTQKLFDCEQKYNYRTALVNKYFDESLQKLIQQGQTLNNEINRLNQRTWLSMAEKKKLTNLMYELNDNEVDFRNKSADKQRRLNKIKQDYEDCKKRARGIRVP